MKTTPRPTRHLTHPGFTLIELLTVIAIIGILAAIIIPTVGKVRESAKKAQCLSNMRQIGMAFHAYASDNKDRFPVQPSSDNITNPLDPATTEDSWIRAIAPILNIKDQTQANSMDTKQSILLCPNVKPTNPAQPQPFSLAMNKRLLGKSPSHPNIAPRATQLILVRHSGRSSSSSVVTTDKREETGGLAYSDGKGEFNYVYADGHAARRRPPAASEEAKDYLDHWEVVN